MVPFSNTELFSFFYLFILAVPASTYAAINLVSTHKIGNIYMNNILYGVKYAATAQDWWMSK